MAALTDALGGEGGFGLLSRDSVSLAFSSALVTAIFRAASLVLATVSFALACAAEVCATAAARAVAAVSRGFFSPLRLFMTASMRGFLALTAASACCFTL